MKKWAFITGIWFGSFFLGEAQTFQAIYNYTSSQNTCANGRLLQLGGTLFGTTPGGGSAAWGSIFKVNTNGTGYSVIKSFSAPDGTGTNVDGAFPMDGLVVFSNVLFGTTYEGGFGGKGTVFSFNTNGNVFTAMNHFAITNGKNPYVGLTVWSNVLYGTTAAGGISNKGAIFRINPDGTGFAVIKSFISSEGILLLGGVTTDGKTLYGTTYQGGISNRGTIYSVGINGENFSVLKALSSGEGASARYNLVLSGNTLYGVAENQNPNDENSVVFRLKTDGTGFSIIKQFSDVDPVNGTNWDGSFVRGGMVLWNGVLFGTTYSGGLYGLGVVYKLNLDGTGFAVLKHFTATTGTDNGVFLNAGGMEPSGDLTVADGVIYGTTKFGGNYGYGTIYRLTIPPVPALHTTNAFGQLTVYWSDDGYNRTVQTTTNLSAGNWTSLTGLNWTNSAVSPKQIGLSIPNTLSSPTGFFRLQ